ncbi:MarR family transcriptional regulator [Amycolatopsis sp. PS_44_ISF1]|uniref:MarR family winged helix-turn-helix transcriptional regulator n=1 Tax=Amycolatopsis sp. PS_44_ISF1 TaxID=2974917 RepID=UPI0028DE0BFC|nr:MarR family transcriptional regulator [Amycolatopsis sp. PS_44_ISF1]MDT8914440.1 MarR family transcriptional regulator [Amycolatopsis sp. PS_44_ISF1]
MSDPGPAPELRLLDALFRLNRSVLADARTHVAAAADLDLADFLTLRSITLGATTPGGLARDLGLNPAVVSRALTRLAQAGLIERRIDPADSRRSLVTLTTGGEHATEAIAARVRPGLAQRLRKLTPEQADALLTALELL